MLLRKKYDQGQYVPLPRHRRLILDICRASRTVPTFAIERDFQLEEVALARSRTVSRIGWAAIFVRAYGIVAEEIPQLRQTFITLPWPRLYQHPTSIVSISVNRVDEPSGDERLIFSRIRNVEQLSLREVQGGVEYYQQGNIADLGREMHILDAMPSPMRRLVWHLLMRWTGRKRARLLGTFSLSTLANYGTTNHSHPLIVTTSLSYSPLDENFRSRVTLQADHRVVDGALLARAMNRLEEVMNTAMVEELKALSSQADDIRAAG